jgi:hypothetical protein
VQEEPDPQVRSQFPQHPGHQLQLVVLYPYRRSVARDLGGGRGESLVDLLVGVPPVPVEHRGNYHVVVERPQRRVGEALVVVGNLRLGQHHRMQGEVLIDDRLHVDVGYARPADPRGAARAQQGVQRGDQPPRAGLPPLGTVGEPLQVHRQPVGHYHEVRRGGRGDRGVGHGLTSLSHTGCAYHHLRTRRRSSTGRATAL